MPPKSARLTLSDYAGTDGFGSNSRDGGRRTGGILDALDATHPAANTVITAGLRQVAPNPDNPRSQLGDLTEMAETIAAGGLIQPLVVMTAAAWRESHPSRDGEVDPDARWVILAGHRRRAAAELAGHRTVPVLVRDDLGTGSDANVTFLVENIHRQNLAPLDEATALSRLAAHKLPQREIARLTGISQAQVSKKLSLLTLPEPAKADMRRGELTFTEALRLLELPAHLQAGVYDQSKQHGHTLDAAIRITTAHLETEATAAAARQQLADEGTRLIGDPAEEFGPEQLHLHHMWDDDDISAAKSAGVCVAHIDTRGRVEYYATTPRPWPWQPPTPHRQPDESDPLDDDDLALPEPTVGPDRTADTDRHDAITAFIRRADPHQAATLLITLTLLGSRDDEDQHLTARFLGSAAQTNWRAHRADLFRALDGAGEAVQTATALALAFARAETRLDRLADDELDDDELNAERQVYLRVLAQHLSYHGADHQIPATAPIAW